jgi:hypothetical protein
MWYVGVVVEKCEIYPQIRMQNHNQQNMGIFISGHVCGICRWNLQVIQHVDVRKWHPWGPPHLMAMFMGAFMISIDKRLGILGALFWDKARAKSNLGGPLESKMGGIGFRHVPSTQFFLNCQTRLNLNIVGGMKCHEYARLPMRVYPGLWWPALGSAHTILSDVGW